MRFVTVLKKDLQKILLHLIAKKIGKRSTKETNIVNKAQ